MAPPTYDPVHFVAPDYSHWTVHEVRDPGAERGRSLIFVSPTGFRRVREYPEGWRALAADELWSLSWSR
jgi:hypothetical protein